MLNLKPKEIERLKEIQEEAERVWNELERLSTECTDILWPKLKKNATEEDFREAQKLAMRGFPEIECGRYARAVAKGQKVKLL